MAARNTVPPRFATVRNTDAMTSPTTIGIEAKNSTRTAAWTNELRMTSSVRIVR